MEQQASELVEIKLPEARARKPWTAPTLTVSSVEEVTLTGGFDNTDSGIQYS
ncbi:MAG TPA: hypothetical protein VEB64_18545 [Azospirillaceae bacterium]|nr:hypothetical protein [Azospirillaceae bacterium]